MRASGLTEVIPFIRVSAIWGHHPASWVFFSDGSQQFLSGRHSLLDTLWAQRFTFGRPEIVGDCVILVYTYSRRYTPFHGLLTENPKHVGIFSPCWWVISSIKFLFRKSDHLEVFSSMRNGKWKGSYTTDHRLKPATFGALESAAAAFVLRTPRTQTNRHVNRMGRRNEPCLRASHPPADYWSSVY